jgi:hypothetical protein
MNTMSTAPKRHASPIENSSQRSVRRPVNTSAEIRFGIESREGKPANEYHPRTALGEKLMALRRAYIANGGILLDDDGEHKQ